MVGEETCVPSQGVGGHGIASEFGDLSGMTRQEVDDFLRGLGAEIRTTRDGYVAYKFFDKSTLMIRPNGEVIRTPAPKYGSEEISTKVSVSIEMVIYCEREMNWVI